LKQQEIERIFENEFSEKSDFLQKFNKFIERPNKKKVY
jgi:hypothetical protein